MNLSDHQLAHVIRLTRQTVWAMTDRPISLREDVASDVAGDIVARLRSPSIVVRDLDRFVRRSARVRALKRFVKWDRDHRAERIRAMNVSEVIARNEELDAAESFGLVSQALDQLPPDERDAILVSCGIKTSSTPFRAYRKRDAGLRRVRAWLKKKMGAL